jgi:hypothetical protein
LLDEQGYAIEYVGSAVAGLPDGTGAMIFSSPADVGPVYFEGGFSHGLPDGVAKIEEPGRKPRVRQFHAGKDRGAASAEDLQQARF